MYYHTAMRLIVLSTVIILAAGIAWARGPEFVLRQTMKRDQRIEEFADWHSERLFDGIGWMIGTAARGDRSIMEGGYTVIHPAGDEPFVVQHEFVLAAFDLNPDGYLLITVRDPEYHWPVYDITEGVIDPLEVVWYDREWEEVDSLLLDVPQELYPDHFTLSPDQRFLLAITHPVQEDGSLSLSGHGLLLVDLKFGEFEELLLPEWEKDGAAPASWWPVKMKFSARGQLLVQVRDDLRFYEVQW